MALRQSAPPTGRMTSAPPGVRITVPDDDLMASGVFVMPGTKDKTGRMLLLLPGRHQALVERYRVSDLVCLLRYYTYTASHAGHRSGFAAVADLTGATNRDFIAKLVETLERMQTGTRDSVHVFYALPPRLRDIQRSLKKQTGLKPSKTHPKIPVFETILLESQSDLHRYIDQSQVGPDLGGNLFYSHSDWIQLIQSTRQLSQKVEQTLRSVPSAQDKLNMLLEYEVPETQSDAEATLLQIRHKYNQVMRELNLEHQIDKCKSLLQKYERPQDHLDLSDISFSPTLIQVRAIIEKHVDQQVKVREDLRTRWQHAEARMLVHVRINKYKNKADKVHDWIDTVGMPTVNQEPEIADCLSKAELLMNHFDTGFYVVAQNVLWLGSKISQKLEDVSGDQKQHINAAKSLRAFSRKFRIRCEYFRQAVDKKRQVYLNVYSFYGTASKNFFGGQDPDLVIYKHLDQVLKWYKKTLQFLPTQLLHPSPQGGASSGGAESAATYCSDAWRATIENYLLYNPGPGNQQLSSMKNTIPVIDDMTIRNQARLLTARVSILRKVLQSPDQASVNDLQDVLRWKNNLQIGEDELQEIRAPKSPLYMDEAQGRAALLGNGPRTGLPGLVQPGSLGLPGGSLALPGGSLALPGGSLALPGGSLALPGGSLAPSGGTPTDLLPKSPGVARRSTTIGARPSAPVQPKHNVCINRTTSLQYPLNQRHIAPLRGDIQGYFSDQDSLLGQEVQIDNGERYVPLTFHSTHGNQELPESLKHIDLNAFKANHPQGGVEPHRTEGQQDNPAERNPTTSYGQQPLYYIDQYGNPVNFRNPQNENQAMHSFQNNHQQQPLYYVDQYGNRVDPQYVSHIASHESLADSGIGHTQPSVHASPEISPGPADRLNSIPSANSHRPDTLHHAQSMPNLNQEPSEENRLLAKPSINTIMSSNLSPEEKLDVMALIIEEDSDYDRNHISVDKVPVHVKNALKKLQPMTSTVKVGDLRRGGVKTKLANQPIKAFEVVQPSVYQKMGDNVSKSLKQHPASERTVPAVQHQEVKTEATQHHQSSTMPTSNIAQLNNMAPDGQRDMQETVRQPAPYPVYAVYEAPQTQQYQPRNHPYQPTKQQYQPTNHPTKHQYVPTVRQQYPSQEVPISYSGPQYPSGTYPYQVPHAPVQYETIPHQPPNRRTILQEPPPPHPLPPGPPQVIPVQSSGGGVLYQDPLEPLAPVLIPVSDTAVQPGEDVNHSRSSGARPRSNSAGPRSNEIGSRSNDIRSRSNGAKRKPTMIDHQDLTSESQTSNTVDTEIVKPQVAQERREPSQLCASALQTDSTKPYGIDIEQWVSQQREASADTHHQGSTLEDSDLEEIETIEDYVPSKKQERLREQERLEKAKLALEEMIVADEEQQQDDVEESLKRTEKMLQEQEELMLQNRINEMVKEAQRAQRQDSITSTAPSGGDDDEPLLGAVGGAVPPGGAMGRVAPPGFPLELLEGASVSGESGVFTQTSAESRARPADVESFGQSSGRPSVSTVSNTASARPSVSSSLSNSTERTRQTSETSSATTTPHGDGPGFFPNRVYKPSAARQHDLRDPRSKPTGDLARSNPRSSARSRGPSATDLAHEPLIEHELDDDVTEDTQSTGPLTAVSELPRNADQSSTWDTTSAEPRKSHPGLTKSSSVLTDISTGSSENKRSRSCHLVDMARSSFARSCDDILDQYGLKTAPKRTDSSSIGSTSSISGATDGSLYKQDSITTTTSTSSLPYVSLNDSVANPTNLTEPVPSTAPKLDENTTLKNEVVSALKDTHETHTSDVNENKEKSNVNKEKVLPAKGARNKLLKMKNTENVAEPADATNSTTDIIGSNSMDLKAREFENGSY